jgi:NAD-dependent DNA ligase
MSEDVRQRIEALAAHVVELREAYYDGETLVADAEYDALEDELRSLIAEHPGLAPDPNPLERVGAPGVLHAPVRHSRPMLSLEKASTPEQVEAFFDRFPGQPVVVMAKLDGVSLALVYQDGLCPADHPRRWDDRRGRDRARPRAGRRHPESDRCARPRRGARRAGDVALDVRGV